MIALYVRRTRHRPRLNFLSQSHKPLVIRNARTRPIRILVLGPSLEILGGQSVQVSRLLAALRSHSAVEVSFLAMNPRLPRPLHALQRMKFVRTVVTLLYYLATLPRAVARCDVLHVFSPSYWAYLLGPLPAMLIGRLMKKTVILDYHSGEADDHLRRWAISAKSIRRLASTISVPSEYLRNIFHAHGLVASCIPNIVSATKLPFRERRELQPRILSNRNLEAMYDVATVIHAFARISQVFPQATLTIAGEGSQREHLRTLAERVSSTRIVFLGRVEPNQMATHYDSADLYLNASRIDNQPLSLIEAMLCGVPVVTTNSGGIPWLVKHGTTGLLANAGDDEVIAAHALRLLDDPEMAQRIATSAREYALIEFSEERVVPQWIELYVSLVQKHSGSSGNRVGA